MKKLSGYKTVVSKFRGPKFKSLITKAVAFDWALRVHVIFHSLVPYWDSDKKSLNHIETFTHTSNYLH